MKHRFKFVISPEFVTESTLYVARRQPKGDYKIAWDTDNPVYYEEQEVQWYIENGIWIVQ